MMRRAPAPLPAAGTRRPAIVAAVLLVAALFAALFPWFPGGSRLSEGRTVDRPIVAPRDVEYDSVVRTVQVRQQAAAAVPEVLVLDPGVRDRQITQLNRLVTAIDAERRLRVRDRLVLRFYRRTLQHLIHRRPAR